MIIFLDFYFKNNYNHINFKGVGSMFGMGLKNNRKQTLVGVCFCIKGGEDNEFTKSF